MTCAALPHADAGRPHAIRSRRLLTLAGEAPARGADLLRPLRVADNGLVVVRGGAVCYAGPFNFRELGGIPPARVHDAGDVCLMPGVVNAHTHIQLSWLCGRPLAGRGFAAWLESLIPLLGTYDSAVCARAIRAAIRQLRGCGCAHVGDVGGSIAGTLPLVARGLAELGIAASHFCEWFGHAAPLVDSPGVFPPRCRGDLADLAGRPAAGAAYAPAGHALYSTAPHILVRARRHCIAAGRPFSFHLAESREEEDMLVSGTGPLFECYQGSVLPEGWRPPGLRPLEFAARLGLLGCGSLAVHGTHLDAKDAARLAASGTALCLCPRSNRHIGTGAPDVRGLIGRGALLCLGTDGLTSNSDLDVRREAVFLAREQDAPAPALLRMLTVNGAAALGLPARRATLAPGSPGIVAMLPDELAHGVCQSVFY